MIFHHVAAAFGHIGHASEPTRIGGTLDVPTGRPLHENKRGWKTEKREWLQSLGVTEVVCAG